MQLRSATGGRRIWVSHVFYNLVVEWHNSIAIYQVDDLGLNLSALPFI